MSDGESLEAASCKAALEAFEVDPRIIRKSQTDTIEALLAMAKAKVLNVNIKTTSGPVLEKAGDLAALLTNLEQGDVLFIDEIHRLSPQVEEILYPAMEDYQLDIMIGNLPLQGKVFLLLVGLSGEFHQ